MKHQLVVPNERHDLLYRFAAVHGVFHSEASSSRRVMAISRLVVVVHEQDAAGGGAAGGSGRRAKSWPLEALRIAPSQRQLQGQPTVNEVPLPWVLFTGNVPCIVSTRFFVMAIPSPVPWMPLIWWRCARARRGRRCARRIRVMPMPVSDTVKR